MKIVINKQRGNKIQLVARRKQQSKSKMSFPLVSQARHNNADHRNNRKEHIEQYRNNASANINSANVTGWHFSEKSHIPPKSPAEKKIADP